MPRVYLREREASMVRISKLINKLENPVRLAELSPAQTLREIGLKETDVFCDIGAGTGIFTFAAASICKAVYALEKSGELADYIDGKARMEGFPNIKSVLVSERGFGLPRESCDAAILCTVLHEIGDKEGFLAEIVNILKKNGRLAIIEFHKKTSQMGPPPELRMSEDEVISIVGTTGFMLSKRMILGDNFYLLIFEVQ